MKRIILLILCLCLTLSFCGCGRQTIENVPTEPETTAPAITEPETTEPEITEPETTEPETTEPEHSPLYIPDVSVEDVITWFNEVCLDSEFVSGGDPSLVQKWDVPIVYMLHGETTEEDLAALDRFTRWLNTVEGFPGIFQTDDPLNANLHIHFTDTQGLTNIMGPGYVGLDGAVTFW